MSTVKALEPGSRYDLRVGISPDAPDENAVKDEVGSFGYCHSYETSSRYDGPGLRLVLFLSGCLLRCTYCHNPDTWHLKDGTYVSVDQVLHRIADFAPSIQALGGGLTASRHPDEDQSGGPEVEKSSQHTNHSRCRGRPGLSDGQGPVHRTAGVETASTA